MNFNFVTNRLATGSTPHSEADIMTLIQAGITHILDACNDFDDASLLSLHPTITYLWNPTKDDGKPKPVSWFQPSIEFGLKALSAPNTKVYAHCAAGINRGPSSAFAILRAQGLDSATAEKIIRIARPQVGLAYKNDANAAIIALGYN